MKLIQKAKWSSDMVYVTPLERDYLEHFSWSAKLNKKNGILIYMFSLHLEKSDSNSYLEEKGRTEKKRVTSICYQYFLMFGSP